MKKILLVPSLMASALLLTPVAARAESAVMPPRRSRRRPARATPVPTIPATAAPPTPPTPPTPARPADARSGLRTSSRRSLSQASPSSSPSRPKDDDACAARRAGRRRREWQARRVSSRPAIDANSAPVSARDVLRHHEIVRLEAASFQKSVRLRETATCSACLLGKELQFVPPVARSYPGASVRAC